MFDVSKELLSYSSSIQLQNETEAKLISEELTEAAEVKELIDIAKQKKRNLLDLFDGSEGLDLQLKVQGHDPQPAQLSCCSLCGQHKE